jgi:hypothetical protein
MIRLCVILLRVALVLCVSLIFEGAKLWLLVKPYQRVRRAIQRRRTRKAMQSWHEEHGGPPDEIAEDFNVPPDEGFMSEAQQSLLRGFLKFAAGALAAKGLIDVGEAAALQVALEALVAGVAGLVGFYLSHKKHAQ